MFKRLSYIIYTYYICIYVYCNVDIGKTYIVQLHICCVPWSTFVDKIYKIHKFHEYKMYIVIRAEDAKITLQMMFCL